MKVDGVKENLYALKTWSKEQPVYDFNPSSHVSEHGVLFWLGVFILYPTNTEG